MAHPMARIRPEQSCQLMRFAVAWSRWRAPDLNLSGPGFEGKPTLSSRRPERPTEPARCQMDNGPPRSLHAQRGDPAPAAGPPGTAAGRHARRTGARQRPVLGRRRQPPRDDGGARRSDVRRSGPQALVSTHGVGLAAATLDAAAPGRHPYLAGGPSPSAKNARTVFGTTGVLSVSPLTSQDVAKNQIATASSQNTGARPSRPAESP